MPFLGNCDTAFYVFHHSFHIISLKFQCKVTKLDEIVILYGLIP